MPEILRMPEVAAGAESALLSAWSIPEGATFATADVLAVIETDKAVIDFEAESGGVLVRRLVEDGAEVAVGAPIALLAAVGEDISDVDAALAALGLGSSPAPVGAEPETTAALTTVAPPTEVASVEVGSTRTFSSPLARKLAREAGIDVAAVIGTGPGGRIVRRDVEAAIARGVKPATASVAPSPKTSSAPAAIAQGAVTEVPHTRLRRAIASRLIESKTTAPHFYVRGTARVDELLRLREQINDGSAVRVSVNDLLIKAMARAHQLVPALNVVWTADAVLQFSSVDIAVAISTDTGLVTPVVRGVEGLTVTQVAATVRDFAERARAGRLQQQELEGGSTSISNLGMYGTEEFAAIINPPQASILAVGASRQTPVVENGTVVVGTVMTVTLSVDHRPVDGVAAAQWMKAFIDLLEHPVRILA